MVGCVNMTRFNYVGVGGGKAIGELGERVVQKDLDKVIKLYRTVPQEFIAKAGFIASHTHSLLAARKSVEAALQWSDYHEPNSHSHAMEIINDLEAIAFYVKSSRPVKSTAEIIELASNPKEALKISESLGRFTIDNSDDRLSHKIRLIVYDKIANFVEPIYESRH